MRVCEKDEDAQELLDVSVGMTELEDQSNVSADLVDLLYRYAFSSVRAHNVAGDVKVLRAQMSRLCNTLRCTLVSQDNTGKSFGGQNDCFDATVTTGYKNQFPCSVHNNSLALYDDASAPSVSRNQSLPCSWRVGDRVEMLSVISNNWVSGKITGVHAFGAYDVQLDNEEVERMVFPNELHPVLSSNRVQTSTVPLDLPFYASAADFTYESDSDRWEREYWADLWYLINLPHFNASRHTTGASGVGTEELLSSSSNDDVSSEPTTFAERVEWKVGDCVEVNTLIFASPTDRWLPGIIARVCADCPGLYSIQLDNGTMEDCVPYFMLRVAPRTNIGAVTGDSAATRESDSGHLWEHAGPAMPTTTAVTTVTSSTTTPTTSNDGAILSDQYCPLCFATHNDSFSRDVCFLNYMDLRCDARLGTSSPTSIADSPTSTPYRETIQPYRDIINGQLNVGEQVEILLRRSYTWSRGSITYVYPTYDSKYYMYDVQLENGDQILGVLDCQLRFVVATGATDATTLMKMV